MQYSNTPLCSANTKISHTHPILREKHAAKHAQPRAGVCPMRMHEEISHPPRRHRLQPICRKFRDCWAAGPRMGIFGSCKNDQNGTRSQFTGTIDGDSNEKQSQTHVNRLKKDTAARHLTKAGHDVQPRRLLMLLLLLPAPAPAPLGALMWTSMFFDVLRG